MLPIIAVVADALPGTASALNQRYAPYAPAPLTAAVQAAGGLPIILPVPKDANQAAGLAAAYASTFAGLILPGGPDVSPGRYGEEPLAACGAADPARDAFELALVAAAQAAHRPVLAICRGLQVYNVALGGTLYQDLPTQDPDYRLRHRQSSDEAAPSHRVAISAGSRTAGLVGTDCLVNSRHHQAVRRLAAGLVVTARAADGVIEGAESKSGSAFVGVQWHPENLWRQDPTQLALFTDLVERVEAAR